MKKRIKVEIEKSTAKAHLVKSRIEPEKTCDVIRLDKKELEIYTGAGWKIAAFDDGRLAKLVDLDEYEWRSDEPFDATVSRATKFNLGILSKLEDEGFECWLVMASCTVLCEPSRISHSDALTAARFARRIGESLNE